MQWGDIKVPISSRHIKIEAQKPEKNFSVVEQLLQKQSYYIVHHVMRHDISVNKCS